MITLSFSTLTWSKQQWARCTLSYTVLRDIKRHYNTRGKGHLEGGQAVQSREFLDVPCRNVETRTVPGTAHVSFRQHTLQDRKWQVNQVYDSMLTILPMSKSEDIPHLWRGALRSVDTCVPWRRTPHVLWSTKLGHFPGRPLASCQSHGNKEVSVGSELWFDETFTV